MKGPVSNAGIILISVASTLSVNLQHIWSAERGKMQNFQENEHLVASGLVTEDTWWMEYLFVYSGSSKYWKLPNYGHLKF